MRVMRAWGKAKQQKEEKPEEEEEEAAAGEDLCHPSAYNRRQSRARSPNYNTEYTATQYMGKLRPPQRLKS